jgi:hypothetical protein
VLHCTICAKVWHVVTATGNRAMAVVVDSSSNRDPITSSCSTGRRRSAQFRSRSSESRSTGFRSRREKLASDGQPDRGQRSFDLAVVNPAVPGSAVEERSWPPTVNQTAVPGPVFGRHHGHLLFSPFARPHIWRFRYPSPILSSCCGDCRPGRLSFLPSQHAS